MRIIAEFVIYKKTQGVPYPGEHWDGPHSEREAKKKFEESYANWDSVDKLSKDQDFRIVKVTYQAVTR